MATGALDANGIWLYGEDDSEPTASALLNKLGNSVSDKFDGGLSIASGGTGATTVAGAQDSLRVGLVPISPTSVEKAGAGSTASANALGQVTFASCTSVSLNGVFSSAYRRYRIMFMAKFTNNTDLKFRLRATTDAESNYWWNRIIGVNNNIQAVYGNATTFVDVNYIYANNDASNSIDVTNPFLAEATYATYNMHSSTVNLESGVGSFKHTTAIAYNGFTLALGAGSMNGTIQVFGYNE